MIVQTSPIMKIHLLPFLYMVSEEIIMLALVCGGSRNSHDRTFHVLLSPSQCKSAFYLDYQANNDEAL